MRTATLISDFPFEGLSSRPFAAKNAAGSGGRSGPQSEGSGKTRRHSRSGSSRASRARWPLAAALGGLAATLPAQTPPFGAEIPVNTYTADIQSAPAIAADSASNFVVTWQSNGQDGSGYGAFGQRYDWLGAAVGSEFAVNTYTSDSQQDPSVAVTGIGSFVVAWESRFQDGSVGGIFGQRFGVKPPLIPILPGQFTTFGPEFPVNTYTTDNQRYPAVAADSAGNFVIVWHSHGQDGSDYGVFGQRFDSSGTAAGPEFPIATNTLGAQEHPAVAFDGAGNFTVVWTGQDLSNTGIFAQRFDKNGVKIGSEFPVNEDTAGFQQEPSIAAGKRGDFVVVWSSSNGASGADGSFQGVFGRRFDSSGKPLGPQFLVNTYTSGSQVGPSVAMNRGGDFVVVWDSYAQDGSSDGVFGQRFDRAGKKVGDEFAVNTYTTGSQGLARVASDGDGFAVVWSSDGQDGSQRGIFARREDRRPVSISVDSASADGTQSDSNGILEPGETVLVAPAWSNRSTVDFGDFAGTASAFTGPSGGVYGIPDSSADYGPMPSGARGTCADGSPNACYQVSVSGTRPATHWDTRLEEDVSFGGGHLWTLHVGDSFSDVPRSQTFYKKIETVLHYGITSGCNATQYCPTAVVTRDAMAIFIARGIAGQPELVPSTGFVGGSPYLCGSGGHSLFTDVAPTDSFCKHVHYLAAQNVTLGCDATHYCPGQTITRDAMASFIAKAVVAPQGGAAVPATYTDPATSRSYSCVSGSPNLHFTDVPVSNAFCKHIHYLWAKGIVDGCTATTYCPSAPVARDAMAKFIANGFGLQLYGP